MRNEVAFPYDPRANIHALRGADKLRAIPDRQLAGYMLALLDAIEAQQPEPKRNPRQLPLPQPGRWASCQGDAA